MQAPRVMQQLKRFEWSRILAIKQISNADQPRQLPKDLTNSLHGRKLQVPTLGCLRCSRDCENSRSCHGKLRPLPETESVARNITAHRGDQDSCTLECTRQHCVSDNAIFKILQTRKSAEMTGYTVHTGASKKFVSGWDRIFDSSDDKPAPKKKKAARKSAAKAAKKVATKAARKAAKKKS